jgi:hypothetical protein
LTCSQGYFSRVSLSKKTPGLFLQDKLLRLGVPTLAHTLLAYPLQESALHINLRGDWPIATILQSHWSNLRGVQGPVWYGSLLLIFDCCHALLFRPTTGQTAAPASSTINSDTILNAVLICGVLNFFVRLVFPSTYVFTLLNLRVGYVPQYVFAYTFGARIQHPNTIDLLPPGSVKYLTAVTIASLAAGATVLSSSTQLSFQDYSGGLNPVALGYAVGNESLGYMIFATCFSLFRHFLNQSRWNVSRYSYGAFLVHSSVSIAIEAACDGWRANALLQTAVVGTLNVWASFVAGWALLQVPGMSKVL